MKFKKCICAFSFIVTMLVLVMWSNHSIAADPGVFPDKIVIGSPGDLVDMQAFATKASIEGTRAYLAKAYEEKIYSREIELVQEHGSCVPGPTIKAATLLIERDKVFCLYLASGTAATLALNSLLETEKVPLLSQHSQAEAIAVPPKKYIFQMYTTYPDQAKIAVDYIVEKEGKDAKIAFFYQDDEFGYDGLKGFQEQMKKYAIKPAIELSFKKEAIDYSSHILKLKSANPDWIILHCLWKPGSMILKEAQKIGWKPQFLGISGTADAFIFKLAGDSIHYGKPFLGVLINHPYDGDSLVAKEYRAMLKKYLPDAPPGTFSFWGYGFAKILVEALKRIDGEPTREKFIQSLETFKGYDSGVFPPLTWGPNLRKGSKGGMIVVQKGEAFVPITGWRDVK